MISSNTEQLLPKALEVINEALDRKKYGVVHKIAPLFSGGHDSYCACFVASQHKRFDGNVYHINTGIGSKATHTFVEQVCKEEGWKLNVLKSNDTYEKFVTNLGFPGPGAHQWVYNWLKDHCIDMITRVAKKHHRTILITGCRSAESVRRMGNTKPIKLGEETKDGKVTKRHRLWTAPCNDWSSEDQIDFMNFYGLSRNPVKETLLGMSGECFCGAFARPDEIVLIRQFCPDVATEIDRLEEIAKGLGHTYCTWGRGKRPEKGQDISVTGPLCTTCDLKAYQLGMIPQPKRLR